VIHVQNLLLEARAQSNYFAFVVKCVKIIRWVALTALYLSVPYLESVWHWVRSEGSATFSLSTEIVPSTIQIDEHDLDNVFGSERGGRQFMNKWTAEQLHDNMAKGPIGAKLREAGFDEVTVEFRLSDPFNHYLWIRSPKFPRDDQYLIYLIVRTDSPSLKVSSHTPDGLAFIREKVNFADWNILNIRWLSLQNPARTFSPNRPRLPGQKYPGSGLGRVFFTEIRRLSLIAKRDGIMNIPEHFHNAVLYKGFYFIDPYHQALFNRMLLDLDAEIKRTSLTKVSWAVGTGALRLDGESWSWNLGEQIFPLSRKAISYFNSCHYTDTVTEHEMNCGKFTIEWAQLGRRLSQP
jgi:hypothetical protein